LEPSNAAHLPPLKNCFPLATGDGSLWNIIFLFLPWGMGTLLILTSFPTSGEKKTRRTQQTSKKRNIHHFLGNSVETAHLPAWIISENPIRVDLVFQNLWGVVWKKFKLSYRENCKQHWIVFWSLPGGWKEAAHVTLTQLDKSPSNRENKKFP